MKVNRVENGKIFPKDPLVLSAGATIYRNSDTAFNKLLTRSEQCRTISLQLKLQETVDGLQMLVRDEDGIESEALVKAEKTVARQAGMVAALAEKQLRKSGGSIFSIGDVHVDLSPELFFPAAVFNDLRRQGLAKHLKKRIQQYQVEHVEITINDFPWPADEVGYLDNICNHKAGAFYKRHGVLRIDGKNLRAGDVDDCALMTTKYCIRTQLEICPKMTNHPYGGAGPLTIIDNTGEYVLSFDCQKCEMTVRKLKS